MPAAVFLLFLLLGGSPCHGQSSEEVLIELRIRQLLRLKADGSSGREHLGELWDSQVDLLEKLSWAFSWKSGREYSRFLRHYNSAQGRSIPLIALAGIQGGAFEPQEIFDAYRTLTLIGHFGGLTLAVAEYPDPSKSLAREAWVEEFRQEYGASVVESLTDGGGDPLPR